ncbi:pilus biosynthesis protein TadE [Algimonas arctica]|uniref:Pilus biosynthesis protein TadE n=1 Tax=Algimonas arctica TaxID=1479486 RepID=A0A8J3CT39_9PROT|nr:TadE family protein [Algimonas arctica]GHA96826.1 pilus biosynthesis protein TadE [Algimonas arctica]
MTGSTGHISAVLRRLRALRRRYRSEADGATAIEFGIVALPFLGLIFGILELALVFFTGSVLAQAMSDTGRFVRVGSFQGCGTASEFKALVCDKMSNLMNCRANLRIDLSTANGFQTIVLADPGLSGLDPDDEDAEIEDGTYEETGPSEPVVMRGTFYYPLALPNFMTRLESIPGSRRHVISTSTAFRTEPFPTGSSCDPALSAKISEHNGD